MPPKKGAFTYSINPELYARAHKPSSTIAMGMKSTQASSQCWANQVHKEEAIRSHWITKYDPEDRQEVAAMEALERTQVRDAARHEAYVSPVNNPEIHTLLYKKQPPIVSVAQASTDTVASPPFSASSTAAAASLDEETAHLRARRAAQEYLGARRQHYTLQQRYPDGPATAAQAVGWDAATSTASSASSAMRVAPRRRPAGAYHKPEDEDHAALLGFDYTLNFLKRNKRPHTRVSSTSSPTVSPTSLRTDDNDNNGQGSSSSIAQPPPPKTQNNNAQREDEKEAFPRSSKKRRQAQIEPSVSTPRSDAVEGHRDEEYNPTAHIADDRGQRRRRRSERSDQHSMKAVAAKTIEREVYPSSIEQLGPRPQPSVDPNEEKDNSQRREKKGSPSRTAAKGVERLLAQYPPPGTPAAVAAEEGRRDREVSTTPRPSSSTVAAAASQPCYAPPPSSTQRSAAFFSPVEKKTNFSTSGQQQTSPLRSKVSPTPPTSQRPLYLNDEIFMQYLRRASPTTADDRRSSPKRGDRHSSVEIPSGATQDGVKANANGSSNNYSTPTGVVQADENERKTEEEVKTDPPRPPSRRRTSSPHSRVRSPKPGAVVVLGSNDSSDGDQDNNMPQNSSRVGVRSTLLVDARKAFKISPDGTSRADTPKQQQGPPRSPIHRRIPPSQAEAEDVLEEEYHNNEAQAKETENARRISNGDLRTRPTHEKSESVRVAVRGDAENGSDDTGARTSLQQRKPSPTTPPLSSPPSASQHPSRRPPSRSQLRAYELHTPPPQVPAASNSVVEGNASVDSPSRQSRSRPQTQPPHSTMSTRHGDMPSPRKQPEEKSPGNLSTRNAESCDKDDRNRSDLSHLSVTPPSLSPSRHSFLGEEERAWTFTDVSDNVTSHRLPHHTSPPAPSPVGTRRLHRAWTSYLRQHGQLLMSESANGNDEDTTINGQGPSQSWMPMKGSPLLQTAAEAHGDGRRESGQVLVQPSSSHLLSNAATAALHDHLREREKEVLLLRASLLMTYMLLSMGEEHKKTRQQLSSSAAAQRWEDEVDRYAGWTASKEQREQKRNSTEREGDDGDGSSAPSPLRSTTPWPALEAQLALSVRTTAQSLTDSLSSHRSSAQRQRSSISESNGQGGNATSGPLPSPRLLLHKTPAHDLKGLPALWYPPHHSDAVGPVSGVLSVWFSGGSEDASDESSEDEDKENEANNNNRKDDNTGRVADASTQGTASGQGEVLKSTCPAPSRRPSPSKKGRSSTPSTLTMVGAWRRCFVVADDRGVRVYPTERDYVDFASERLLMAVPYASLAYLIPDFAEAAAAISSNDGMEEAGTTSSLSAVHICTVAAIGSRLHSHGDLSYVHFGFLQRQTSAVEQRVAASAAATGASLLRTLRLPNGCILRFAPWRMHSSSKDGSKKDLSPFDVSFSSRSTPHLHAPLVFRTQSRLTHAEWVHYFAFKFNRHLYRLLFPMTCAAMAEVGLKSQSVQTDTYTENPLRLCKSEKAMRLPRREEECEEGSEQPRHPRHRQHSRHHSCTHHGNDADSDASSEGRRIPDEHGSRRSSLKSSTRRRRRRNDSYSVDDGQLEGSSSSMAESPSHVSAPSSPLDFSNQITRALKHDENPLPPLLNASTSSPEKRAALESDDAVKDRSLLVQAVADLRHALEQRDAQVDGLESEQTALTKSLRQREHQVQELQHKQVQLREALRQALDREERQRGVADSHNEELRRLRSATDSAVLLQNSSHKLPGADLYRNDEKTPTPREAEEVHKRELTFLKAQVEDLQRRYAADEVAWRAKQQALEARCRMTEMQVQNLRENASHQIRFFARQVVHDLDDFHDEVAHGTENCVTTMLDRNSTGRQLQAPPQDLYEGDEVDGNGDNNTPQRSPRAVASTTISAAATCAFASLLLTFQKGKRCLVDGELAVDEKEARLLYSGPTANQRGRRWELRHHDTDALLCIQLELLSRIPADRHRSSHAQRLALLNGPPSLRSRSHSCTATQSTWLSSRARRTPPSPLSPPLSSVLCALNVSPRDTRTSRLRQAAIERQIRERESLEGL